LATVKKRGGTLVSKITPHVGRKVKGQWYPTPPEGVRDKDGLLESARAKEGLDTCDIAKKQQRGEKRNTRGVKRKIL